MSCQQCGSGNTSRFTIGTGKQHDYCHKCGGHVYEGQVFDKRTWDRWINGEIERPEREEQLDMWGAA